MIIFKAEPANINIAVDFLQYTKMALNLDLCPVLSQLMYRCNVGKNSCLPPKNS